MGAYLIRRLILVIPTLFGIIAINFAVVQLAPGGPVEQMIAELKGRGGDSAGRVSGAGGAEVAARSESGTYRGRRGLDPHLVDDIRKMFGYDKDELWNTVIKTYPKVSQFWTYGKEKFLAQPVYSRDFPPCKFCE